MWFAGDVLQHLLDVLFAVVAGELFDHRLPFFDVWRGPNEEGGEVDANHVGQRTVFLRSYKQVPTVVAGSNRQGRDGIMVVVHDSFVVREIVEDPKYLRYLFHPSRLRVRRLSSECSPALAGLWRQTRRKKSSLLTGLSIFRLFGNGCWAMVEEPDKPV